jgi:hypothetical protein
VFKRTCEAAVVNPSRAVTFVPGAAGAGEFWSPVVQQLPKTWDIDVIDLPGLGAVPPREGIGSYDDLVEYVRAPPIPGASSSRLGLQEIYLLATSKYIILPPI